MSSLDQQQPPPDYFTSEPDPQDASPTPAPPTPPPSSISELESRTFETLKRCSVVPQVDTSIRLVHCAGRKDDSGSPATAADLNTRLQLGLVRCLTTDPRPRFLSLTLTDTEPPSLLLEKRLLGNFEAGAGCQRPSSRGGASAGGEVDSVLLGSKQDVLVPITLDLRGLPMESTGIVCGIAGRLVGGTSLRAVSREGPTESGSGYLGGAAGAIGQTSGAVEMSYLSTARAGTVMVAEVEFERALEALKGEDGHGLGLPKSQECGREDC